MDNIADAVSPRQLEIMQLALGLNFIPRVQRNYFHAGPDERADCLHLVARGLMEKHVALDYYHVTALGRQFVEKATAELEQDDE